MPPTRSASSIDKKGKIAWIFHDAQYYVTTSATMLSRRRSRRTIRTSRSSPRRALPDPARAEDIANAILLKNPDLDGVYVTWAEPAEGVLAALRSGRAIPKPRS